MSQKEQEAAIDERIERIRKRNEEIQRRYLEVEADKLNAEKLNAAVKFSPSAKNPNSERKSYPRPQPINRNTKLERKVPDKPYVAKHQIYGKKSSSFSENDGPPPDPVYTFLSDSSRDTPKGDHSSDEKATNENFSSGEFRGSRGGGRSRGWSRGRGNSNRGGRRGPGNQPTRQSPQMQPDYQAWRAEREKIDQDRITRQKTAEGNWRREWDSKKLSQDENQEYHSRPSFAKKKKRDGEELKIQRTVVNELAVSSPSPKELEGKTAEKSSLSKPNVKVQSVEKKTVVFNVRDDPSAEKDKVEFEEFEFEHRNIVSCGDSIKISVSNKPIKSVKVNPVNTAGTGRVGPRQKPRLSYSSQSEDEKEMLAPILRKRTPPANQNEPSSSTKEDTSKKPPLPPRGNNSSPRRKQMSGKTPTFTNEEGESLSFEKKELSRESSHENVSEGGDDSWEDVATSGNESAEFSDADVAKRADEGEIAADEEVNIENETQDKVTAKEDESEKKDNLVASEISEVTNEQEESQEKEELTNKGELASEEVELAHKEEELPNEEECPINGDFSNKEEEFGNEEEELTNEENESANRRIALIIENQESLIKEQEEEGKVETTKDVEILKEVDESTKTGEDKETSEGKGRTESLKAEEELSMKISIESTVEKSADEIKKPEIAEIRIGEQHIQEKDLSESNSKGAGIIAVIEKSCKEILDINQKCNLLVECLSKQEGSLKNEDVKSDSPEVKVKKLEENNKVTEDEDPKALEMVEDTSVTGTKDTTDNCAQNMIVSNVPIENLKQEKIGQVIQGNDLHSVTILEET